MSPRSQREQICARSPQRAQKKILRLSSRIAGSRAGALDRQGDPEDTQRGLSDQNRRTHGDPSVWQNKGVSFFLPANAPFTRGRGASQ